MQVRKGLSDENGLKTIKDLDFKQAGIIVEQREKGCAAFQPGELGKVMKRITIKAAAKVFDSKGNPMLLAAATDTVGAFSFFSKNSATP